MSYEIKFDLWESLYYELLVSLTQVFCTIKTSEFYCSAYTFALVQVGLPEEDTDTTEPHQHQPPWSNPTFRRQSLTMQLRCSFIRLREATGYSNQDDELDIGHGQAMDSQDRKGEKSILLKRTFCSCCRGIRIRWCDCPAA